MGRIKIFSFTPLHPFCHHDCHWNHRRFAVLIFFKGAYQKSESRRPGTLERFVQINAAITEIPFLALARLLLEIQGQYWCLILCFKGFWIFD